MAVHEIERRWIGKFQENLSIIRKVAGWTTQELADELGVARQTVSNLETGKTPMSKLQYLALRTVFNAQIAKDKNRDLARVIKTLVDDPLEGTADASGRPGESPAPMMRDDAETDGAASAGESGGSPATARGAAQGIGRTSLSAAMQILTIITGALASGAAAGALAFLMFPDSGKGRR